MSSRDIGLEHLGRDRAVIGDREELAEIVAERRDHLLVARAVAAGEGAGHQRVGELVGGEADLDRLQPGEASMIWRRGVVLMCLPCSAAICAQSSAVPSLMSVNIGALLVLRRNRPGGGLPQAAPRG
jgi:hypothetical protein